MVHRNGNWMNEDQRGEMRDKAISAVRQAASQLGMTHEGRTALVSLRKLFEGPALDSANQAAVQKLIEAFFYGMAGTVLDSIRTPAIEDELIGGGG